MKLKEVYKKYGNDYDIQVFGKPLKMMTIPFTHLPNDKKILMSMEVVEMKFEDKEYIESDKIRKDKIK